jgi:hypothetical protein
VIIFSLSGWVQVTPCGGICCHSSWCGRRRIPLECIKWEYPGACTTQGRGQHRSCKCRDLAVVVRQPARLSFYFSDGRLWICRSRNGDMLAVGTSTAEIQLWDTKQLVQIRSIKVKHSRTMRCIAAHFPSVAVPLSTGIGNVMER